MYVLVNHDVVLSSDHVVPLPEDLHLFSKYSRKADPSLGRSSGDFLRIESRSQLIYELCRQLVDFGLVYVLVRRTPRGAGGLSGLTCAILNTGNGANLGNLLLFGVPLRSRSVIEYCYTRE